MQLSDPTAWALLSISTWGGYVSLRGWHKLGLWDKRQVAFAIFTALLFLNWLTYEEFEGWSDVYYFCGSQLQYCTCGFKWNARGWAKAYVLWSFVLTSAAGLQRLLIQVGLNGLLPGEEVVTRESIISICWRLIPYWLNNWEQQWGAECSSMMFELPHFAVELLVILPCIQILCARLKVLVMPLVHMGHMAAIARPNAPAPAADAAHPPAAAAAGQPQPGAGGAGVARARGRPGVRGLGVPREELAPNVLRGYWEHQPQQRHLLHRLKANAQVMAFAVVVTALAATNALVVPLLLESTVSHHPVSATIQLAGRHPEWFTNSSELNVSSAANLSSAQLNLLAGRLASYQQPRPPLLPEQPRLPRWLHHYQQVYNQTRLPAFDLRSASGGMHVVAQPLINTVRQLQGGALPLKERWLAAAAHFWLGKDVYDLLRSAARSLTAGANASNPSQLQVDPPAAAAPAPGQDGASAGAAGPGRQAGQAAAQAASEPGADAAPVFGAVLSNGSHVSGAVASEPAADSLSRNAAAGDIGASALPTAGVLPGQGQACAGRMKSFRANLVKHSEEISKMQAPEHQSLIPLVESALAVMRLSCEKYFVLLSVFVAHLLFRERPPHAVRVMIRANARLSTAFQKVILYSFPAVCWVYGAGFLFSLFVSCVFWGTPLMAMYESVRTAVTVVRIKSLAPAGPEAVERMGGNCAICWGEMHVGHPHPHQQQPGSATAAATPAAANTASPEAAASQAAPAAESTRQAATGAGEGSNAAGPAASGVEGAAAAAGTLPQGGGADGAAGSAQRAGSGSEAAARAADAAAASDVAAGPAVVRAESQVAPCTAAGPEQASSDGALARAPCVEATTPAAAAAAPEGGQSSTAATHGTDSSNAPSGPAASTPGVQPAGPGNSNAGVEAAAVGVQQPQAPQPQELPGAAEAARGVAAIDEEARGWSLPCGHAYHHACLSQWLSQCHSNGLTPTCPMCQARIQLEVRWRLPCPWHLPPDDLRATGRQAGGEQEGARPRQPGEEDSDDEEEDGGAGGEAEVGELVMPRVAVPGLRRQRPAGRVRAAQGRLAAHDNLLLPPPLAALGGMSLLRLLEHQREVQELLADMPQIAPPEDVELLQQLAAENQALIAQQVPAPQQLPQLQLQQGAHPGQHPQAQAPAGQQPAREGPAAAAAAAAAPAVPQPPVAAAAAAPPPRPRRFTEVYPPPADAAPAAAAPPPPPPGRRRPRPVLDAAAGSAGRAAGAMGPAPTAGSSSQQPLKQGQQTAPRTLEGHAPGLRTSGSTAVPHKQVPTADEAAGASSSCVPQQQQGDADLTNSSPFCSPDSAARAVPAPMPTAAPEPIADTAAEVSLSPWLSPAGASGSRPSQTHANGSSSGEATAALQAEPSRTGSVPPGRGRPQPCAQASGPKEAAARQPAGPAAPAAGQQQGGATQTRPNGSSRRHKDAATVGAAGPSGSAGTANTMLNSVQQSSTAAPGGVGRAAGSARAAAGGAGAAAGGISRPAARGAAGTSTAGGCSNNGTTHGPSRHGPEAARSADDGLVLPAAAAAATAEAPGPRRRLLRFFHRNKQHQ